MRNSHAAPREIIIPVSRFSQIPGLWVLLGLLQAQNCPVPVIVAVEEGVLWLAILTDVLERLPGAAGAGTVKVRPVSVADWTASRSAPGWVLAARAALGSSADEVLLIDPQTVPLRNPAYLFDHPAMVETGWLIWPKYTTPVSRNAFFQRLGLEEKVVPEVDDAQMMISLRRHRPALIGALALAGDDDCLFDLWGNAADAVQYVCLAQGIKFAGIRTRPMPLFVIDIDQALFLAGMCYFDPEEEQIFQNRRRYPWLLTGTRPVGGGMFEPQCFQLLGALRKQMMPMLQDRLAVVPSLVGEWRLSWMSRFQGNEKSPVEAEEWLTTDLPCHTISNFDRWPMVRLWEDGVAGANLETGIAFWSCESSESQEGERIISLLNSELDVVCRMTERQPAVFSGLWQDTNQTVYLIGKAKVFDTRHHGTRDHRPVGDARAGHFRPIHLGSSGNLMEVIDSLLCCCALASRGEPVIFHSAFSEWFHRLTHPDLAFVRLELSKEESVTPRRENFVSRKILTLDRNLQVARQNGLGPARAKCRRFGADLSPCLPARIDTAIRVNRLDFTRYIVIVPYSGDPRKDWPVSHWLRLVALLRSQGRDVVAVGMKDYAEQFRTDFGQSHAFWANGEGPEWMLDVLLASDAVVAPSSPIAYLAGLHGIRTLCLDAEFTADYFADVLSLEIMGGNAPCRGCWRDAAKGYLSICSVRCAGAAMIYPEMVAEQLCKPAPEFGKTSL